MLWGHCGDVTVVVDLLWDVVGILRRFCGDVVEMLLECRLSK